MHPVMESARQRFNLGFASFRFPVMAFVTFAPEGSNPGIKRSETVNPIKFEWDAVSGQTN